MNLAIELSYLKVNLDIELIPIHPKVNPALAHEMKHQGESI
jgi:hypothetical protein